MFSAMRLHVMAFARCGIEHGPPYWMRELESWGEAADEQKAVKAAVFRSKGDNVRTYARAKTKMVTGSELEGGGGTLILK